MPNKMASGNIGKALLISPIVAPLLYALGTWVYMVIYSKTGSIVAIFVIVMIAGLPISFIATLLIGVPLYGYLEQKQRLSKSALAFGGAASGALLLWLFFESFAGNGGLNVSESAVFLIIGAILGGSVGFVFGHVAGITSNSRRPSGWDA